MSSRKASPEMIEFLEEAVSPYNCQPKKMFGSPTWFVNNNMFCGVHENSLFIRFSETDRKTLLSEQDEIAQFEPSDGKKMREYLVLPEYLCANREFFDLWFDRAYRFVASLPPKVAKPRRTRRL